MNSLFQLKVSDRVIQMSRATKPGVIRKKVDLNSFHDLYSCLTYNAWGFKVRLWVLKQDHHWVHIFVDISLVP